MKKIIIVIISLLIAVFGVLYFKNKNTVVPTYPGVTKSDIKIVKEDSNGYKNISYVLDDQTITLKNGVSEIESAPGSASKITTTYFGNEVKADFNGDGREDIAFILSQETGGTGVFFYLVVALNTPNGYIGSKGYFIGDRIAPQSTNLLKGNIIVVNYADRAADESFSAEPTVGKSLKLKLNTKTMKLDEVK